MNVNLNDLIKKQLGEQNLYKIDRWKYPDKLCRHNNLYVCKKCADELGVKDE